MFWGFPGSSVGKESTCNSGDPGLTPGSGSSVGEGMLSTPIFLGFPGGSDGNESAYNVGDLGSIPGLERSPGGGHGNPHQCPCLKNPHGQRSLVGSSSSGRKESYMTEQLNTATKHIRVSILHIANE